MKEATGMTKGKTFTDTKTLYAACDKFTDKINKASKLVKVLRLKDTMLKDSGKGKGWEAHFVARFDIDDPYIDQTSYRTGKAFVYLGNGFYKAVSQAVSDIFDLKPEEISWSKHYDKFWFSGYNLDPIADEADAFAEGK